MFVSQWALGITEAAEAMQVRKEVFMEELGWPNEAVFDPFDEYAAHLLVLVDDAPAASARLYALQPGILRMDLVCVKQPLRQQHYGDLCFRLLMDKAANMGAQKLTLRTAEAYMPYFEKFGFAEAAREDEFVLMEVNPANLTWPSLCGGH